MQSTAVEEARMSGRGSKLLPELVKVMIVCFLMICITGILSDLACALMLEDTNQEPWATIILLYGEIVGIGSCILYCTVLERRSLRSMGLRRPVWKPYCAGLCLGALLMALVMLMGTLAGGFRYAHFNADVDLPLQLLLLGGYVVQGMSEEILCRSCALVTLSRKNSMPAAIVCSSLLFSMIHVFNDGVSFLPLLNLFLFGVFESLLFLKTDSIWAAGAVHSIWNYLQGSVFGMSISGNSLSDSFFVFEQTDSALMNGGAFGPEGSILVTAVLLAAIAVLLSGMADWGKTRAARFSRCA